MVQGLRDAANLAWKLHRVLAAGAPESLLDSYEAERKPHVQDTTRSAIGLGRVICERDPAAARARDERMLAECGGVVPTTIRQSMLPDLAAGLVASGSPGAGCLFPQPRVTLQPSGRGGLRVLADDDALAPAAAQALHAALQPLQGRLLRRVAAGAVPPGPGIAFTEEATLLADWQRSLGARFAIVRPDHAVYATAADSAGALHHLHTLAAQIGRA
jgi:3-(3-hydroxy-phenyl)propionate hydroxylase